MPTANSYPTGVVEGPDGNIWFTEYTASANQIGRMTPCGAVTEFPVPTPSTLFEITAGADGNLWFAEGQGNNVGRITPAGTITEFPVPTAGGVPYGIASGPDGNIWFTESGEQHRTNYAGGDDHRVRDSDAWKLSDLDCSRPRRESLVHGVDGKQHRQDHADGLIVEYPIPTQGSQPYGIVTGPDGNLWFAEQRGNNIGRITPQGAITEFPVSTQEAYPLGIASGPDGNLWFTESQTGAIGRVSPAGVIAEFPVPTGGQLPQHHRSRSVGRPVVLRDGG